MDAIRLLLANNAVKKVKESFEKKSAYHAYIVEGEKETISSALTLFSAFAVCKKGGCLLCNDCVNALKNIHFDVKKYPQNDTGKMKVDDARSIVNENLYKARVGKGKVILIDACACSYDNSWQRILLKTIEEPSPNVYIFIGTTNAGELLDTIRSRCYCVSLDKMSASSIAQYFTENGFDPKQSQIASVMCEGNIVRAETILNDRDLLSLAEVILDMFINMNNSAKALPYVEKLSGFDRKYRQVFSFMQAVLKETLVQNGPLSLFKEEIRKIKESYTPDAVVRIIPEIDATVRLVANGTYYSALLDGLIMKILEVKYRCRP